MKKLILLFLCVCLIHNLVTAQMTSRVLRDSLFIPWEMVYAPDNHIWFTQKNGYICRLNPVSRDIDTLYHEPAVVIQSEGGMLGLALHPDFPATPSVYVAYNYMNGSTYTEKVVRLQYNATSNSLSSPQTIIDNIGAANFHNGCRLLAVGAYLYITTGDATTPSVSQNVSSVNGKILRLNLDGSIPTDNPIPGNPAWSWGHRNPQGLVFANNKLYQTEHGPNNDDEVNIIQKGRNYGWPNVEGFCNLPGEQTFCNDSNVAEPLRAWTPTIAVCGVDYYDHPMFPSLQKSLIMATLKDSRLYQLKLNGTLDSITSATIVNNVTFGRLRDVCISPDGRIYISTSNSNAAATGAKTDKIIELYDPNFNSVPKIVTGNVFTIAPNPASDIFMLTIDAQKFSSNMRYVVVNTMGQIVTEAAPDKNIAAINAGNWPAGVYVLKLYDGDSMAGYRQLIKQ